MHVAQLEEEMRAALRSRRSVYESEREVLLRAFREVDDGSGDVDEYEFGALWARLGVELTEAETRALFARHTPGKAGRLAFDAFALALTTRPARKVGSTERIRKGAFVKGQMAGFDGKILYRQCKKGVFTPSGWDARRAIEASSAPPEAELDLEFVYGYSGLTNTAPNLFYTASGAVVYYTAGIGIVYDKETHTQRFFRGHDDDIKSLALLSAEVEGYPARTLVATGQVTPTGGGPYVCVWDSRAPEDAPVARLDFDGGFRGIIALAFSPDGSKLVTVASDNQHTVTVWDWREGLPVGGGKGANGEPPQVYGVAWDEYAEGGGERFLTYGVKHVKMWSYSKDTEEYACSNCAFGKHTMQNVVSAMFLPGGAFVTGHPSGEVYVWHGGKCVSTVATHAKGPVVVTPDGTQTHGGVRCLRMRADGSTLLTGGADGFVRSWDVSDGHLSVNRRLSEWELVEAGAPSSSAHPPAVRGLDCRPGDTQFIAGTSKCDVWEVDDKPSALIHGHAADLYYVAWHPLKPNVFASACESSKLSVWDASARELVLSASVGFHARVCTFSTGAMEEDGAHHLAVGGKSGKLRVLHEETLAPISELIKDAGSAISDLRYSPDSTMLAAASHDQFIDVYAANRGYAHIARCRGHSATVTHLDWSRDSSVLQSNCAGYEILYWDARAGKQFTQNQRDTEWASWTCVLGFPTLGIWPDGSDGTDVNAVDASASREVLATSDDSGKVKLFAYPCVVEDAPFREYGGHSSHVMCVRFACDDSRLVSAGGKDRAIFQFRTRGLKNAGVAPAPAPSTANNHAANRVQIREPLEDLIEEEEEGELTVRPPLPSDPPPSVLKVAGARPASAARKPPPVPPPPATVLSPPSSPVVRKSAGAGVPKTRVSAERSSWSSPAPVRSGGGGGGGGGSSSSAAFGRRANSPPRREDVSKARLEQARRDAEQAAQRMQLELMAGGRDAREVEAEKRQSLELDHAPRASDAEPLSEEEDDGVGYGEEEEEYEDEEEEEGLAQKHRYHTSAEATDPSFYDNYTGDFDDGSLDWDQYAV